MQFQRERSVSTHCVSLSGNCHVKSARDPSDVMRAVALFSQLFFTVGPRQVVIAAAEHHVALCLAIYTANLSNLASLTRPPPLPPSSVPPAAKVCIPLFVSFASLATICPPLRPPRPLPPPSHSSRAHSSFRRSSPTSPATCPLNFQRWLSLLCLRSRVSRCCPWALLPFAY